MHIQDLQTSFFFSFPFHWFLDHYFCMTLVWSCWHHADIVAHQVGRMSDWVWGWCLHLFQLLSGMPLHRNRKHVFYTPLPLSPSSIIWYRHTTQCTGPIFAVLQLQVCLADCWGIRRVPPDGPYWHEQTLYLHQHGIIPIWLLGVLLLASTV